MKRICNFPGVKWWVVDPSGLSCIEHSTLQPLKMPAKWFWADFCGFFSTPSLTTCTLILARVTCGHFPLRTQNINNCLLSIEVAWQKRRKKKIIFVSLRISDTCVQHKISVCAEQHTEDWEKFTFWKGGSQRTQLARWDCGPDRVGVHVGWSPGGPAAKGEIFEVARCQTGKTDTSHSHCASFVLFSVNCPDGGTSKSQLVNPCPNQSHCTRKYTRAALSSRRDVGVGFLYTTSAD